jgi:hypothetical protein
MRNVLATILVGITVVCLAGCEEEVKPSKVYGEISFSGSQCGGDFPSINGTLAEGGAKYFGYCNKSGDTFDFVVGTEDKSKAVNASDFYLRVTGIAGPPTEGVFGATPGQPKDDDALYTTFEAVLFKNVNDFTFELADDNDFDTPGLCDITLFAKPIEGELNPNKESFDFYVSMECGGIAAPSNTDDTIILRSMQFQFFFSRC